MSQKKAFISGITGQDGSYLAELLLEKGYEVHAIVRRVSIFTTMRIDHLLSDPNLHTHHGDLTDSSNLHRLISEVPEYTAEVTGIGTVRILDAIRDSIGNCKFYQASTSELFGGIPGTEPQNELTPFYPKSPYGTAKLYSYWATVNYRESYGMFACNGILFNHESPRRGETFVTKKITKAVANIAKGEQDHILLGNINAKRDWGHAKDYVNAMWLMLQQKKPDDFVIATGHTHTVKDFVNLSFKQVDIDIEWEGEGVKEVGVNKQSGKVLVKIDKRYFRPAEVEILQGDSSKARKILNWEAKISFEDLVKEMVQYDLSNT